MLFLSMLFMLLAVIAMYIEYQRYGPQYYNTQDAQPSVMVMPTDNVRII